ncbi:MAG: ureidoglycolate lyase [Acidobacteriota bacterium]|nr:ureidoglycolate lyase [Blastocatellia bacterium]MDW8411400.1 ureidoglycolate lyase [Acidobacteriota bacterium]
MVNTLSETVQIMNVPVIKATKENLAEYGLLISDEMPTECTKVSPTGSVRMLSVDTYWNTGASARILYIRKRPGDITSLERYSEASVAFIGIGQQPFALLLGKPNQNELPDLSEVVCFVFCAGQAVILHKGTWHELPLCIGNQASCVSICPSTEPEKIDIKKRTNNVLYVHLDDLPEEMYSQK